MYANAKHATRTCACSLAFAGAYAFALLFAGSAQADDANWKQNYAACAGNSPFIERLLAQHDETYRPLMRIGDLQAWAVRDEEGRPTIALTTEDGLTIIGRIIGPQGEDISAALLATQPNQEALAARLPPSGAAPASENGESAQSVTATDSRQPQTGATTIQNGSVSPSLETLLADTPARPVTQPSVPAPTESLGAIATAPITAAAAPTPEVQAGMDAIYKQAAEERIWFSAATPNPDAPVVYMLADPECPHCQWTIDKMHSQISSGEIDLRIIFAPITGVGGCNTSLSILHSEDIPATFMSHMTSKTRGTAAVAQMDTTGADHAVVQGIVDNINWMRVNRMPGVPFFLYRTDEGTRFAFSELPANILTVAKPN